MENLCKKIRRRVVDLLYQTQSCHLGSNMSVVEILVALYFEVMKPEDVFVPSKGWMAAALYAVLAEKGIIPKSQLLDYFKKYHLISHKVPGIIFGTGSGGQGLPVAIGMALADRNRKVYCLMSDGEMQEGTTWEGAMFAAHHKLGNLVVIVDFNHLQAFGRTNKVIGLEPLLEKWVSFNWLPMKLDGHNLKHLKSIKDCVYEDTPRVFVAHTIKGKGISFAEDKLRWHYLNMNKTLYEKAICQNSN